MSDMDHEQQLADLLTHLAERQRQGDPADLDAVARAHPDFADELRELWHIAQLAHIAAHSSVTAAHAPRAGPAAAPALPRRFGDYELQEELGRGGMGVVYKAWDERLQRPVALKMILHGDQASDVDLARFRAESQAVAGLTHRHIVPVYAVGDHDGQAYFSMQYVPGPTLSALAAKGPLPSRRAAQYLAAITRAVQHAHEHGLLHRDLKPSNVLIDPTDQPLVTDFGLAKRVAGGASLTGTGAIVGTPSYMAPEQASGQGHAVTAAADVYSLGAILYELLTGKPPFQAASVVDLLLLVRSEEPIRPRLLSSHIDPDLELICLKCLEKRPEHRYASAAALADDLERYLHSEPVQARSSSLVYFLGRIFRETHHAPVMENWGGLWLWHSLKLFLLCLLTNTLYWYGVRSHAVYLALWSAGLILWGAFFWQLRRRGGPVSFVERQIAHAWGAGVLASIGTFCVEVMLDLKALELTPVLSVMAGMVFLFMAGTLTGWFYVAAFLCFIAAVPMALVPDYGPVLFGTVAALGFFVPGLRYYRRRNTVQ